MYLLCGRGPLLPVKRATVDWERAFSNVRDGGYSAGEGRGQPVDILRRQQLIVLLPAKREGNCRLARGQILRLKLPLKPQR